MSDEHSQHPRPALSRPLPPGTRIVWGEPSPRSPQMEYERLRQLQERIDQMIFEQIEAQRVPKVFFETHPAFRDFRPQPQRFTTGLPPQEKLTRLRRSPMFRLRLRLLRLLLSLRKR